MENLFTQIKQANDDASDKDKFVQELRDFIAKEVSELKQPIDNVQWVDIDMVKPNDYNPNSVAKREMKLLYVSIKHDGFTQPIVTIYDKGRDKYIIVDGFHRYYTSLSNPDILEQNHNKVPIVVISKDINDRMASTVRHNRARGKHSVEGMSTMVFKMLENGWDDSDICNELGMEAEELVRLKYLTGFAKLFKDTEYRKAWVMKNKNHQESKTSEETSEETAEA